MQRIGYLFYFTIIFLSCKEKDEHPIVLGNIELNKPWVDDDPKLLEHLNLKFYINESESDSKLNHLNFNDEEFIKKDSLFLGQQISKNCFRKYKIEYFFNGFPEYKDLRVIDTNFNVSPREFITFIGGKFRKKLIANDILSGVNLELCTYSPNYSSPCNHIIINNCFNDDIRQFIEFQMIEKYGKPTTLRIDPYDHKVNLNKLPLQIEDTSNVSSISYLWKLNGFEVNLLFQKYTSFSKNINDVNFKKFEDKEGQNLSQRLKKEGVSSSFRVINNKIISCFYYIGQITYNLESQAE